MTAPATCNTERLVAYLYGEDAPAQRQALEVHLASCPACSRELRDLQDVRQHLARWEAPEIELGFRIHRDPVAAQPVRRWWPVPAWAQAVAAVFVLTAGAALANLDVRYGSFSLRVGWDAARAPEASQPGGAASQAATPTAPAPASADAVWRDELDKLAGQLRAEIGARAEANRQVPVTSSARADRDALVQQMRALITESERRQQRELALRLTQVIHDVERQRQDDLTRIEQTFGQLEGFTGAEAARQRELLNYLMRVSQPR